MMFIVILVIRLHVDHFLNVEIRMARLHAHVYQHILDLLQTVVQNVPLIPNVQVIKLVYKKSVETHVLDPVASMQFALLSIIRQFVHVQKKILVIHLLTVIQNPLHVSILPIIANFQF